MYVFYILMFYTYTVCLCEDRSLGSALGFCWHIVGRGCSFFCGFGWSRVVSGCTFLSCRAAPFLGLARESRLLLGLFFYLRPLMFLVSRLLQFLVWDVWDKKITQRAHHHLIPWVPKFLVCLLSVHISDPFCYAF